MTDVNSTSRPGANWRHDPYGGPGSAGHASPPPAPDGCRNEHAAYQPAAAPHTMPTHFAAPQYSGAGVPHHMMTSVQRHDGQEHGLPPRPDAVDHLLTTSANSDSREGPACQEGDRSTYHPSAVASLNRDSDRADAAEEDSPKSDQAMSLASPELLAPTTPANPAHVLHNPGDGSASRLVVIGESGLSAVPSAVPRSAGDSRGTAACRSTDTVPDFDAAGATLFGTPMGPEGAATVAGGRQPHVVRVQGTAGGGKGKNGKKVWDSFKDLSLCPRQDRFAHGTAEAPMMPAEDSSTTDAAA